MDSFILAKEDKGVRTRHVSLALSAKLLTRNHETCRASNRLKVKNLVFCRHVITSGVLKRKLTQPMFEPCTLTLTWDLNLPDILQPSVFLVLNLKLYVNKSRIVARHWHEIDYHFLRNWKLCHLFLNFKYLLRMHIVNAVIFIDYDGNSMLASAKTLHLIKFSPHITLTTRFFFVDIISSWFLDAIINFLNWTPCFPYRTTL